MRGEVAQQVHGLVEVAHRVGLVADQVVEPVARVGVDEAVPDPLARGDGFVDVCHHLEGGFHAIFVGQACGEPGFVVLAREAQDVEGFVAGERDEFARGGPVDGFRVHFDAPHQGARVPVEEANTALPAHAKEMAARKTFGLEADVDATATFFFEVAEDLDSEAGFADGVVVGLGVDAPGEILGGAEGFVAPCEGSVDDVFAVSAYGDESTVGRVGERLRIDFAVAQILCAQIDRCTIFGGRAAFRLDYG